MHSPVYPRWHCDHSVTSPNSRPSSVIVIGVGTTSCGSSNQDRDGRHVASHDDDATTAGRSTTVRTALTGSCGGAIDTPSVTGANTDCTNAGVSSKVAARIRPAWKIVLGGSPNSRSTQSPSSADPDGSGRTCSTSACSISSAL